MGGAGPERAGLEQMGRGWPRGAGLEQMGKGWPREEGMDWSGNGWSRADGAGSREGQGWAKSPLSNVGPKEVKGRDQSFVHWAVLSLIPRGSVLTFTSILWEEGGRRAATNQSPGAG